MWVGMSGGDLGLCLSMVLLDTLLAPFSIPLVLELLVGTSVEMDVIGMMQSLLLMVGVPALLAMTLQKIGGGRLVKRAKPALALPSKVVLLVIVTALTMSSGAYLLGYLITRMLKKDFPITLTLIVDMGFRNISAGIVLAQQYFPVGTLLPVSLLPMFQQFLVSLVVKVLWNTKAGKEYARLEESSS